MKQKIYQIDAFTANLYGGNPAAVCVLQKWLPEKVMQNIAMENNLAETAFVVKNEIDYEIRWFTPETEVDLCGHATLASAYVIFNYYEKEKKEIVFASLNRGLLHVSLQEDGSISLDFPKDTLNPIQASEDLIQAIGKKPVAAFKGITDIMLIFKSEKQIRDINPNFHLLGQLDVRGIIISAEGDNVDFVSRFFAPNCGINEDPVTGSAHTSLVPYWSEKLGKNKLSARQLSRRGGAIECRIKDDRVILTGFAVPYLEGYIAI